MEKTYSLFSRPLYVMVKSVGSHCNLACEYCYYLEKGNLYKDNPKHIMSDELLEKFVEEYINSQTTPQVLFTWHGGETFMRPLSFYKKAMEYQNKYARGRQIDNCIQTNGTLITDEWCKFLHDNNWLVGVSIDGPQEFHDEYRRNKQGVPSFQKVMKGIQLLNKYDVQWNAMAVINDYNADYPLEFYRFFKEIGCKYIQFAPIVERMEVHPDGRRLASMKGQGELTDFSVTPEQWGNFLCTLFDEWVRNDVGEYYIQLFDSTLANWVGEQPGVCTMAKECGHAGVMEFNGDVYSCDHFVFPEYKLGNIYSQTLVEMMYSERQQSFGRAKKTTLTQQCRQCEYLFACNGECPKNRFVVSETGEEGQNYLCKGYYQFFKHVAPYMEYMKTQLQQQQAPANVMNWIREKEVKL
ncbi:MAG: anaerobic sulfatase-maturation protein [Bacteroidales bacterium]